jgi:branched-subunit amino acid transport protein AzlD
MTGLTGRVHLQLVARVSAWITVALLGLGIVWCFSKQNYFETGAGLASLLVYLWFQFGFNRIKTRPLLRIPDGMKLIISLTAVTSVVLGRFLAFYKQISWFDKFQHFQFGFIFCLLGLALYYRFNWRQTRSGANSPGFIVLFAVSFSHLCCFVWEMYEYTCDRLFGTNMQAWKQGPVHGLLDTMNDLIFGLAGALLLAIAAFRMIKQDHERFYQRYMAGFIPSDTGHGADRKQYHSHDT